MLPHETEIGTLARWQNIICTIEFVFKLELFSGVKMFCNQIVKIYFVYGCRGLHELISPVLLKVFCPAEMQIMISGSISDINLGDWKSNTRYSGGYTSLDPYVQHFWSIVESMSEIEKGLLLRFVTSVPRPPSLGFSALNPPFTIQRVEVESDNRLPTSSTCFNILKLPKYSNKSVLKEKILLAIQSRSGFDLS